MRTVRRRVLGISGLLPVAYGPSIPLETNKDQHSFQYYLHFLGRSPSLLPDGTEEVFDLFERRLYLGQGLLGFLVQLVS